MPNPRGEWTRVLRWALSAERSAPETVQPRAASLAPAPARLENLLCYPGVSVVSDLPLVSIVTPCHNSAAYLPDAIASVLSQDYPRIEYIVMDGGSTDGTIEILERFKGRLHYNSAPDLGAADAINQGFRISRGSVLAWLNADDTYLPGAVSTAVRQLSSAGEAAAVYGEGLWVDEAGNQLRRYPTGNVSVETLSRECCLCQPACFFQRDAFEHVGRLDPELQSAFDYDLWIRMARAFPMVHLDQCLATSRMHRKSKTLGRRAEVFDESFRVLKRHYGYIPFAWVYSRCCYSVDRRDQFYEPLEPSLFKFLLALPAGCLHNRGRMGRYIRDWWSAASIAGLMRRWKLTRPQRASDAHQNDRHC